ncbi:cysteine--tRNA ligase [Brevirhabdus pacifica]|uniref:Cysteine--tRNA ligase n=1 Tax=Brevirhabdus pacifica TaxID=1267768 RepID=A0A1U7DEV4_9RHOB|nr:cysteine--tRNA ligase [Brevirhabdus pacifica]APX88502.1 cysteine--tRNA ligase [Brevirhabdus pacifica]OWU79804.1 cysteinyl-tRNA synthetase [Loktanella sp. 22II-4b]PJJ87018.1 cysteinyl-tRNA synthetase [Brevirhabdus pacifica]
MSDIRLTNTATRSKELFRPIDPQNVRMYVCGPTVYDRAHMGNARPAIVFDVLFRLLRHVYGPEHVRYVRNITDIDDKINARAAETGRPIREITDETAAWYLEDMAALGNLTPTVTPRATEFVDGMIAMIEQLIASGHAYEAEGHVLFSVESYDRYGRLSGRSIDDMIAGARVEVAPYKRNPMDFVLWKPSGPDLPGWDSPWGRGRPGWHIECSAMSRDLLGESFDIHGGGNDLMFPHHENEIAQSCCANPNSDFARVWMHNEMLQVEGKKMSKSLGNFFTVRDLIDQGIPGEVIRFVFLSTHYGKPMDWTERKAQEAAATLRKWRALCRGVTAAPQPDAAVLACLADDLNTAGAITEMHRLASAGQAAELLASAAMLGLLEPGMGDWAEAPAADLSAFAEALAARRAEAMVSKDFSQVDALKQALVAAGVDVRMSKTGVDLVPGPGFDPAAIEGLI